MDELAIEVRAPGEGEPDSLAILFPQGTGDAFSNGTRELDGQLKGRLQRLADSGELKGDLGTAVVLIVYQIGMRWGARHALVAAGLMAVTPTHVAASREISSFFTCPLN